MKHNIIIPPNIKRVPTFGDEELRELERKMDSLPSIGEGNQEGNQEDENQATSPNSPPVTITPTIDYWEIDGVEYRNGIYQVKLAKALLDNGTAKTQDDWAEYRIKANEKGEFYTADMPLHHSIFTALLKSQTDEAQEARKFIKKQMKEKWLLTLTRIIYNPTGKDKVIHNYNILKEQYELKSNLVGKDGFIQSVNPTQYLEELIGTKDIAEINKVYQSINQKDAYIWRLNSKPEKTEERVARFRAGSDVTVLSCYGGPQYSYASLGVRLVASAEGAS